MSNVNVHQWMTSAEQNFNQIDGMTHSIYKGQHLSPATLSLLNGLMNKVAMMTGTEVIYRLSNTDFYTPKYILSIYQTKCHSRHC